MDGDRSFLLIIILYFGIVVQAVIISNIIHSWYKQNIASYSTISNNQTNTKFIYQNIRAAFFNFGIEYL